MAQHLRLFLLFAVISTLNVTVHAQETPDMDTDDQYNFQQQEEPVYQSEFDIFSACEKASGQNLVVVDQGAAKKDRFLVACAQATNNSRWCQQLVRPNPTSSSMFTCTYGPNRPHILIHPDERTWTNAFQAVNLVEELSARGLTPEIIYNWWRPEPYNKNVQGAAGRHPFGTAVDVRFKSVHDLHAAHAQLCRWRAAGRLRALGSYGDASRALHLGIGDHLANTWGLSCP